MAERVTQRERFVQLRAVVMANVEGDIATDLTEFIDGRIAALDKKRSGSKANAKRTAEQNAVMGKIRTFLGTVEDATATEVAAGADVTVQKATAMLRKMDDVVRTELGGKKGVRFSLGE